MKQFLFIVFLTILITINVTLANAEIISAKVSVVGMACPFCAYGVEKKLKKVEGVGSIIINMQAGTVTMSAKKGESINVRQVPEAVEDSGFSLGKIVITVRGKIRIDNQKRLLLQVAGSKERFLLKKSSQEIKKQIAEYDKRDSSVEITGVVNERSDRIWILSVGTIREVVR